MNKNVLTYIKFYSWVVLILVIVGYILFNSRILIEGPTITIKTPQNGSSTEEKITKLEGETKNTTFISINDRPITIDENGKFSETLLLLPGYNIIVFRIKDKFNRELTKKLELFYKQSQDEGFEINFPNPPLNQATTTNDATTTEQVNDIFR